MWTNSGQDAPDEEIVCDGSIYCECGCEDWYDDPEPFDD